MTIEELLVRYEAWDERRRGAPHFVVHPTKAGFVDGFDDVGLGKTKQTLYNYLSNEKHGFNMPWPLLPEDGDSLVFVIFAQPPYDITYARKSVSRVLGYRQDELVGHSVVDVLRRGVRLDRERQQLRRLYDDPTVPCATLEHTWLVNAAGLHVPVRLEARYTGHQAARFYFQADVVGTPTDPPESAEPFNVYPDYIFEPKQARLVGAAQLLETMDRLQRDPESMRAFIDKAIGTYQPPRQD